MEKFCFCGILFVRRESTPFLFFSLRGLELHKEGKTA